MSYQQYLQKIQELMALGMYNVPIHYSLPFMPAVLPMQNVHPKFLHRNETIVLESESDEEDDVDERTLFCANLHENVSDELLYEVFVQAGPIQKIHIPKDNAGKSRSYGFVTFKYRSTIPYAMRLYQGLVLFNKRLDIKFQGKCNFNGYNM